MSSGTNGLVTGRTTKRGFLLWHVLFFILSDSEWSLALKHSDLQVECAVHNNVKILRHEEVDYVIIR